ncbi:MAG: carbohydrate binding family 9 domain-containing protein [Phycisphaerales bacterium]|nr:carbohydrate binding family 9 domain-containing protein [Phycisphaerales bacterium]
MGIRCYDSEPDRIIATQMMRDGSLRTDDRIMLVIDPYFDRRNGYFIETNPLGAKLDALVEDNWRIRRNWDGIWSCKASIDDKGWTAEFAIPFKTISFNPDTTRWGFNVERVIRRTNERDRWASPSRDRGIESVADAGVLEDIGDIEQGVGLDFKPYLLGSYGFDHSTDRDDMEIDGGFDLFYKVTPSLTFALTYNTDFAETEVDDRQVNLSRFPLFFPEKRDFFLQDAGIFDFGGIGRNPLPFHSRRIGLGPSGEVIDILAGAKLTGSVGNLNVGLLDVQMRSGDGVGEKNLFVGRISANILEQSTVGMIFTNGDPHSDGDNWIGGADFNYRTSSMFGDKTFYAHIWAMTSDSSDAHGSRSTYGGSIGYPNDRIAWHAGYLQIDDDFNAALGFVPRRGIREYFGNWRYRWRPAGDAIRRIDSGVSAYLVTDLDGNVETRDLNFDLLTIETQHNDTFGVSASRHREVLDDNFEISEGIILAPGNYTFDRYSLRWYSSAGRPINVSLSYSGGEFYTGNRNDYSASVAWRVSPNLNLNSSFTMDDVHLDEGDFITRIIRGRINILFTPDLSWSTYVQYDNVSESIGINSRVHWIIEPGNEVYFVINQALDRDNDSFELRETELTAKVGWTFRF